MMIFILFLVAKIVFCVIKMCHLEITKCVAIRHVHRKRLGPDSPDRRPRSRRGTRPAAVSPSGPASGRAVAVRDATPGRRPERSAAPPAHTSGTVSVNR